MIFINNIYSHVLTKLYLRKKQGVGPWFLNSCFRKLLPIYVILMARMVAPQRATKCRELIPIKEMKIRLPVIWRNISLNVFQRPGQDLGWRRRWNKPVPSPRWIQSLKWKSTTTQLSLFSPPKFSILVFLVRNNRNELQQEKETRYQVTI